MSDCIYHSRKQTAPLNSADLKSFASFVMQLTEALHTSNGLRAVLSGFCVLSGARVVHVYRQCLDSGRRQTIAAVDCEPERECRPLIRDLGQTVVPEDLRYVQVGTLWTLSELDEPICDTLETRSRLWMEDRGFREAGLIPLWRNGTKIDVMEFYSFVDIKERLRTDCEVLASLCAAAWGRRPKGRISSWLRRVPRIVPRTECQIMDHPLSPANPWKLTAAEVRICALIREGSDTADIVARTGNSIATVRTHLRNIYAKAQITGQVALVWHLMGETPFVEEPTQGKRASMS